jgi:2-isopropylmalate synthase
MSPRPDNQPENRVIVFDTTLRDGEQAPGFSMHLAEKLEMAAQLARLGVDVIEAGFPITSPGDFEAVSEIAKQVHGPVICGLARTIEKDVVAAGKALEPAARKRIHTFIATSKVHVEKKLRMSREEVVKNAYDAVKLARTFTDDVEFSCEDAGRTDWDYIVEVLTAAIEAGATTLNIPDTVGYCVPEQFGDCIKHVLAKTPGIGNCIVSVHCHNDLGLATANSLAGLRAGARQVECAINGIGERAGNTALEEVVMMLATRKDYWGLVTGVNTRELYRASRMLQRVTGVKTQPNKAVVGANAFAHEAGIHQHGMMKDRTTYEVMLPEDVGWTGESMVMGKHSGRAALVKKLEALGVAGLSDAQVDHAYDRFKALCDLKKDVYEEDLLAIVEEEAMEIGATWKLHSVEVHMLSGSRPRVRVQASHGEEPPREAYSEHGDGVVDALYRALDSLTEHEAKLLDYRIESVGQGKDAQGRVTVKLKVDEREARGVGVDTDVIVASARAYLNAINRVLLAKAIAKKAATGPTV